MKYISFLLIVASIGILSIASCKCNFGDSDLVGNGKISTEKRPVPPFNAIAIKGIFNIEMCQTTAQEYVEVTADENLQSAILTSVENNTLTINQKNKFNLESDKLVVKIYLKKLEQLDIEGVGSVTCTDTIRANELYFNSTGIGEQHLLLNVNTLKAAIKSIGEIKLAGRCKKADITNKSVGKFDASRFITDSVSINHQGIGEAFINGSQSISIHSSALGQLKYSGGGRVDKLETEGLGKVSKE